MVSILFLSSFLETLVFCHNLANQLSEKHADKFIPRGGLVGRAYAELRLGKADWPELGSLLKSPVWSDPAFATLRQRLLNPQGGTAAATEPSTGSKDIITFQAEFGDWRKMVIGGADLGPVVAWKIHALCTGGV